MHQVDDSWGTHVPSQRGPDEPAGPRELPAVLSRVLAPGGLRTVTQPLVRTADGTVVGYEALSRTADLPGVPPDRFLALAGVHGCRTEVELACVRAALEAGRPPGDALLFLNVSPALLLDPRFAELVPLLPPHVLELTEHEPVADYGPLRERLSEWQDHGTLLAVDDVGAGYATMAHVVRLSPAFLKIDRSLVAGLHVEREQRALVAALCAFAAQVGAACVAEGVELAEELEVLRDLGVPVVQGYLVARPGPGWPEPVAAVRRTGPVPVLAGPSSSMQRMETQLAEATTVAGAGDAVCRYLYEHRRLLPSVYLERGGTLRCVARRGQWQVLDGLPAGAGITGSAYATGTEQHVADVTADPRYRPAIPGVRGEAALPVRVDGGVAGVLNAEALTVLTPHDLDALRTCADLLGRRLAEIGIRGSETTLHLLSRLARQAAGIDDPAVLAAEAVEVAVAVSGLDAAALFLPDGDALAVAAACGPAAELLSDLAPTQLAGLVHLVDGIASCHTGGGSLDLAFGPMGALRARGVRAVLVVPVRDGAQVQGLLVVTGSRTATVPAYAVEAVELLALHLGASLAARSRLREMRELAFLDPLTRIGNRARFEQALDGSPAEERERPADDRRAAGAGRDWLAMLDVDRFKQVNDRLGHAAGDDLLRSLAEVVRSGLRDGDEVFRIGGDEIAVLLRDVPEGHADAALARMHQLATVVLDACAAGLSVGLAPVVPGRAARTALARADRALYRMKHDGGGGIAVDGDAPASD